jgi:hypothetical protein
MNSSKRIDPDPDPEDRALPHHPRGPHVLAGPAWIGSRPPWATNKNINPDDLDLISVVDKPEDAVAAINAFYSKYMLKPNF